MLVESIVLLEILISIPASRHRAIVRFGIEFQEFIVRDPYSGSTGVGWDADRASTTGHLRNLDLHAERHGEFFIINF